MKNIIMKNLARLGLCASLLFVINCSSKHTPDEGTPADTSAGSVPDTVVPSPDDEISDLCNTSSRTGLHVIRMEEAVGHIFDFQSNFGADPLVTDNGWSEISRTELSFFETPSTGTGGESSHHCGLMMYFCLNPVCKNYYVAYHIAPNLSTADDPFPIAATADLKTSVCCGRFTSGERASSATIQRVIEGYEDICRTTAGSETFTEVNTNGNNFMNHINGIIAGTVIDPVAFFHKDQVNELLTQNDHSTTPTDRCRGIRIYFGYADDGSGTRKIIKAVAYAVDGNGKNITTAFDGTAAKILQKSWPPS
ncbi:MAG TPA: hypothetical protein VJY62_02205 [Bacteroidia bacterium]|nr:hypothetical protein [Bacteroidia bacterium]